MRKIIFSFIFCFIFLFSFLFAFDSNKLTVLTKKIIETKQDNELFLAFNELKDLYFSENKYNDFIDILKSLRQKRKNLEPFTNYYIAFSRYYQLKYLEETQSWDEYFSRGNTYRDEITEGLKKTIAATTLKDPLYIYAKLLLWEFHQDRQDVFCDGVLADLMNSVLEYSKEAQDYTPLKDVADASLSYGEKAKSKELYDIYVNKLIASNVSEQDLSNIALGFYQKGNLELSEAIYNVYMERVAGYPKEELMPILVDVARRFSYSDEGTKDPFYAEEIFQKIESLGGKEAFDEGLIYLRAFNLEKSKEYNKAKDIYIDLTTLYPLTPYADEAKYKIGIIYTYILGDMEKGESYFQALAQKEIITPQVISGFYQLGLLSQWKDDFTAAKDYYNKLIEKAGDNFGETVTKAQERLKEIEDLKPMEYNLKTFLDVSLKEENKMFDMTKLNLSISPYKSAINKDININSSAYSLESGCMPVELQYLWSGHTGTIKLSPDESSYTTTYLHPGTKEVNLVVVSPSGIIDREIALPDIN